MSNNRADAIDRLLIYSMHSYLEVHPGVYQGEGVHEASDPSAQTLVSSPDLVVHLLDSGEVVHHADPSVLEAGPADVLKKKNICTVCVICRISLFKKVSSSDLFYLTRAVSSPVSDPVKAVLGAELSSCPVVRLSSCPSLE